MRILFLTDNFPPEVNAPASRTFEHCREWVGAGHKVTVITGAPNFPKGELVSGYRNLPFQRETLDGIEVLRVMTYITANEGFARRSVDYLSFMITSFLAGLFVRRPDVVIGTSPQFFTVCSAWMLSVFKRRPFVFELRDLWPESIETVGAMQHPFWLARLEKLAYFLYRKAALIVTVTHAFRRILIGKGINADGIEVVTNGADLQRFQPRARNPELAARYGLDGKFVVGYIGTHGLAHGLETLLEAAAMIQRLDPGEACLFLFLGDGASKQALMDAARQQGLNNVVFLDSVPKDDVVEYWALVDASIVHLKKTPLFESVIPSKLFESMAMGLPILHGVAGESADIVRDAGAGLLFAPEDSGGLRAAILRLKRDPDLYRDLSGNCIQAARRFDRQRQARSMLQYLQQVVDS